MTPFIGDANCVTIKHRATVALRDWDHGATSRPLPRDFRVLIRIRIREEEPFESFTRKGRCLDAFRLHTRKTNGPTAELLMG